MMGKKQLVCENSKFVRVEPDLLIHMELNKIDYSSVCFHFSLCISDHSLKAAVSFPIRRQYSAADTVKSFGRW